MPLPSPKGKQDKKTFMSNCMGDGAMKKEFPDQKQRSAVCYSKWRKAKGTTEIDFTEQIKQAGCPLCGCLPCVCGSHSLKADEKAGYPPKCNPGYEASKDGKKCVPVKGKKKNESTQKKENG